MSHDNEGAVAGGRGQGTGGRDHRVLASQTPFKKGGHGNQEGMLSKVACLASTVQTGMVTKGACLSKVACLAYAVQRGTVTKDACLSKVACLANAVQSLRGLAGGTLVLSCTCATRHDDCVGASACVWGFRLEAWGFRLEDWMGCVAYIQVIRCTDSVQSKEQCGCFGLELYTDSVQSKEQCGCFGV